MAERNDGGPAFPLQYDPFINHPEHGRIHREQIGEPVQVGMSLRDWFAGKALLGILASPPGRFASALGAKAEEATAASLAFALSDAMLAERSK